jgi:16S rRNA (cytosine967-C5)-methyltransferase
MRAVIQMQKAIDAIEQYKGDMPLSIYLKQYCRLHKEMGSRDRRFLQELSFHYFRLNKALQHSDIKYTIATAHYVCTEAIDEFIIFWNNELQLNLLNSEKSSISFAEKIQQLQINFEQQFPSTHNISSEIDKKAFLENHIKQPFTWIRCKSKNVETVKAELKQNNIEFTISGKSANALGIKNHSDFSKLNSFERGFFEVQDLSSQLTGNLFQPKEQQTWWDCCAASGGKSLLLKDIEHSVKLLATDSRPTIISNLLQRFKKANIQNYETLIIDLETKSLSADKKFDAIIIDAPCTGSGTWSRNPERMTSFKEEEIALYTKKQFNIAKAVVNNLKPDGRIIYITCSIYRQENEENINRIATENKLTVKQQQYLHGYKENADTMFVAILCK